MWSWGTGSASILRSDFPQALYPLGWGAGLWVSRALCHRLYSPRLLLIFTLTWMQMAIGR